MSPTRPTLALLLTLLATTGGCGASLPPRYVIEQDVESYHFRRYQKSTDVELAVEDNPAVSHLATYVRGGSALRGQSSLRIAPVTLTAYQREAGLAEALRTRLRDLPGYEYGVGRLFGEWVWTLKGEQDDHWLLWPSKNVLVKMGVPEGETQVPGELAETYLDAYPSDLEESGRARD